MKWSVSFLNAVKFHEGLKCVSQALLWQIVRNNYLMWMCTLCDPCKCALSCCEFIMWLWPSQQLKRDDEKGLILDPEEFCCAVAAFKRWIWHVSSPSPGRFTASRFANKIILIGDVSRPVWGWYCVGYLCEVAYCLDHWKNFNLIFPIPTNKQNFLIKVEKIF